RGRPRQLHDAAACCRFPAARFPDQAKGFSLVDVEADVRHGMHLAARPGRELNSEVLDLQQRIAGHARTSAAVVALREAADCGCPTGYQQANVWSGLTVSSLINGGSSW